MTTYTVAVELFVDGAWLDITRLDNDTHVIGAVTITRGRTDEQSRVGPTSVTFSYLDNNATLDGENPRSIYYRKVGLGTPLRVSVDAEVRALVELSSWAPSWDEIDSVVIVDVEASGILRRLDSGRFQKPLRSPAYRALTASVNDTYRVAYWPLEEESGATTISSPYSNNGTAQYAGTINFGAEESISSARLAEFASTDALMFFTMPSWTNSLSQHIIMALMKFPAEGLPNNGIIYRMYFTDGNVDFIDLVYTTGDVLSLKVYTSGALFDTAAIGNWANVITGKECALIVRIDQSGADIAFRVEATTEDFWVLQISDTTASRTVGRLFALTVGQADITGLAFGQLIVGSNSNAFGNFVDDNDSSSDALVTGARGYDEETAGDRMERLADEEDFPITVDGVVADSERLGQQGETGVIDLVFEAAEADMGLLFENRTAAELEYRPRTNLYSQAPAALTYDHLSKGFRPVADDQRVTNAVTVDRDGGSSAAYSIPDGDFYHWTTEDPPDGAGLRESSVTLGLGDDSQADDQAAWRAHIGAWREKRFAQMTLELSRSAFDSTSRATVASLDIGDVMAIDMTGAPNYVPSDELRLMVQGYTEVCDRFTHTFTFNTSPADPWEVEVVDTGGSTLAVAISNSATSLKLATSLGPEWSTTDEPYYIQVNGDAMQVTTMTTDTPAFIAAGTVAHAVNASVSPGLPAGMTVDTGQIMFLWAAIRNSGTGTVNVPTGWTSLVAFGNTLLAYRYYVTGDSAPTVSFSGGAASEDTSARIVGFSGLSHQFASGTRATPAAATQLNGSAANVAYPALNVERDGGVILYLAWKQDDWTSVATIGDAEIFDNFTTTGNDQAIAGDYDIYTTATDVTAGSWTVTGGASAISRAVVAAFRPLQTATVTRGTNGASTSHAVGDAVHAWRAGVNGL